MSAAERVYDRSSFCTDKLRRQTREQIVATGCAATCSLKPPSAPVRGESVISCASAHVKTLLPLTDFSGVHWLRFYFGGLLFMYHGRIKI